MMGWDESEGEGKFYYLPTVPAAQFEFSVERRIRPCWRCRLHLWWPPWRKHWQCRPHPPLEYLP